MDLKDQFRTSSFWRMFPAGMRRRWWMFRPLDLLARAWPVWRRRRGVLVIRMDGIGDMILFRPSLDHYAEALGVEPAEITILGCDSWAPLTDRVFAGFKVITIDEHAYARQPFYRLTTNLKIRALAPEVVVCDSFFRRALMADSLTWVTGAPRQIVSLPYVNEPTRAEFKYYLGQVSQIIDTGAYPAHELTRHRRFIEALTGQMPPPAAPNIDWPKGGLPQGISDTPYVVLNPGSNEYGRRWPLASYASLGKRLERSGFKVVIVGKREEKRDDVTFERFVEREAGVIDLRGRTSLGELVSTLNQADLVVTNDTGPAHLSIALGTPTVVIGGGGHFGSFVPYPEAERLDTVRFVHSDMDCFHCFWRCDKRASKFETFPCVGEVGIEQVWEAAQHLLQPGLVSTQLSETAE